MKLFVVLAFAAIATANAMCPGDGGPCSGHGTCGAWDLCTCHRNWQNADCSDRICPYSKAFADIKDTTVTGRGEHFYLECGGKGTCDRKSGECNCFDGFEGLGCDRMKCPSDCNGHGTCETMGRMNSGYALWDADKIQVCSCDPGWSGAACENRKCKLGDDPLTLQTIDSLNYQVNEIQTITFADSGGGALTGHFTISYEDWRGETFITRAIDIATATALTVSEALEALPNDAIPSVTVTSSGAGAASGDLVFSITFDSDSTPGNQPEVTVNTAGCTTAGCQPYYTALTSAGTTTATVATATAGTEERVACSNRGRCNEEDGLCECFAGYYGEACEIQTIIT